MYAASRRSILHRICQRKEETIMRLVAPLALAWLLTGCVSYTNSAAREPHGAVACADKEASCKEICGPTGIQSYSCRATPREGMDYKCECKKP